MDALTAGNGEIAPPPASRPLQRVPYQTQIEKRGNDSRPPSQS